MYVVQLKAFTMRKIIGNSCVKDKRLEATVRLPRGESCWLDLIHQLPRVLFYTLTEVLDDIRSCTLAHVLGSQKAYAVKLHQMMVTCSIFRALHDIVVVIDAGKKWVDGMRRARTRNVPLLLRLRGHRNGAERVRLYGVGSLVLLDDRDGVLQELAVLPAADKEEGGDAEEQHACDTSDGASNDRADIGAL